MSHQLKHVPLTLLHNSFGFGRRITYCLFTMLLLWSTLFVNVYADSFSANFKNTDIHEFINTVSKNLNKTVIIDPTVKGNISVRSYEELNDEQYYQFFLSVLDVYGFTVIPMKDNVLKVIPSKSAKGAALPLADNKTPGEGDEVVIRVVPVHNVDVKDLAPLLRQLNDTAGIGNVVHYESSNVLLLTGRAAVVNRLLQIIKSVDQAGDQTVESVKLQHAAAAEVARLVSELTKSEGTQNNMVARVVADERTNAILVSGEAKARARAIKIIRQLDKEQLSQGNTKVISLKYAKAPNLVEVLTGVSASLQNDKENAAPGVSLLKNVTIKADELTNSLIITAAPDVMRELEQVIEKLDIRRAQVLVEAIIVEVQDADGLNLGVQWFNQNVGGTNFSDTGTSITNMYQKDGSRSGMAEVMKNVNGLTAGFYHGNWSGLLTALMTNSKNDILATPSIVTLDNMEAEFSVGQDVPILTGSQTTNSDNVFNTVSRKSVGIKLKVKPQINQGDSVLLQIEQEVSSVAEKSPSSTEQYGATFNTRTVNNAVLVGNGETVVVGGLLDKTNTDVSSKVPLLGDIPLIGYLFRSTTTKTTKRNLMLFIRPTIIREQEVYNQQTSQKLETYKNADPQRTVVPLELQHINQGNGSTKAFIQVSQNIQALLAEK